MSITNTQLLRYHPTSFIDSDNNRLISRDEMVSLLNSNVNYQYIVSYGIYKLQLMVGPYELIHDNIEMLELLHFDSTVYKRLSKVQMWKHMETV